MEIKGEVLLHGYGEARKESFQCHCLAGSSHIQLSMGPAAWLVCLRYIGDKADSCQQASPKCSHTNRFSMAQGESQPTGKALKTLVFISAEVHLTKPLSSVKWDWIHPKAWLPNGNPQRVFPGCMNLFPVVFKIMGTHLGSNSTVCIQLAGVSPAWQPQTHCTNISRCPYTKKPWDRRQSTWPWKGRVSQELRQVSSPLPQVSFPFLSMKMYIKIPTSQRAEE